MKNRKVWKFLGFLIGLFILIQAILEPSNSGHLDVLYHANLLKTENDLANMINALENFKEDVHRYPSTKEGLDALMSQPRSSIEWRGPYITQPELTWKREIQDPWGSKYIYLYPAQYGDGAMEMEHMICTLVVRIRKTTGVNKMISVIGKEVMKTSMEKQDSLCPPFCYLRLVCFSLSF